jgi:hypothetical protein
MKDYLSLIKQNEIYLYDIPIKFQTYDICLEAVKQYGWSLEYVPGELRTLEICSIAFNHSPDMIYHIPRKIRTYEMYLIAVRQNIFQFEFVSIIHQTDELCKIALQYDLDNFQYIKNPSEEIINLYNLLSI